MDNNNLVIAVVVIVAALMIISYSSVDRSTSLSGSATEIQVGSSALISSYFAIAASNTLTTDGIKWSNIQSLPVTNLDADGNTPLGTSQYSISVSPDSNVNVDLCIKANAPLTSGLNTIPLANYLWDSNTVNPLLTGATAIGTTYTSADAGITPGGNDYYRFWLSIAGSQSAVADNNTSGVEGVETGNAC